MTRRGSNVRCPYSYDSLLLYPPQPNIYIILSTLNFNFHPLYTEHEQSERIPIPCSPFQARVQVLIAKPLIFNGWDPNLNYDYPDVYTLSMGLCSLASRNEALTN